MDKTEFKKIRKHFGKTQEQLAQLLNTSHKAIQSFEQGWRNIPANIERQLLFLLAIKRSHNILTTPCWMIKKCSMEVRTSCPAWEYQVGSLGWFINGTICGGVLQASWKEKMKICRECEVFQSMMPDLLNLK